MNDLSTIVFMKVGKFYECYGPYVETIEKVLGLKPDVAPNSISFPTMAFPLLI